jgi:hypothetical protein
MLQRARHRRPEVIGLAVALVAALVFVVLLIWHNPYTARSPKIRVTVAGGCPKSLGKAADVSSPGPSWWHELWSRTRLAPTGATSGRVCVYGLSGADGTPTLRAGTVMSAAQAAGVSAAAHAVSTKHPSGNFKCPAELFGTIPIVVLGYPKQADVDIWWNYSGCQTADNGHVEAFQGANDSFGDFQHAVSLVVPVEPSGT